MFLKQAIISLFLIIFFGGSSYSQVNLTQGLVAYFPFNGNANDASGNNINGVVNGAVLTTDAASNVNSAYLFDGTASFISLPFNSKYDFAPTDSFSIAAWVQPYANTIYAASALVVKSPFNSNYLASMWNYGLYTVNNKAMSGWAANNIINGTTTMQPSQCWYHLAVTYKNGIWHLYVNGLQEAQDLTQTKFIIQDGAASTIAFGRKGESSGDYYKGKIDDVRIYNRNLNPSEVKALYDMYNAKPEFSFTQDICNPKQITFKNETENVSSFNWDFGNNTTNNSSTNPIINYSSHNNYSVKLVVTNLSGCKDSVVKNIPVTTQFVNGLIKNIDTAICNGASFKLNVQDSGLAYCWSASNGTVSNSSAIITVAPSTNTTYYYNTQVLGTNLIVNGDFENGNTGFTSEYAYEAPPNTIGGTYYVATNPSIWNGGMNACTDHTSGVGKMLLVNGSSTLNTQVWKGAINTISNTNYAFSVWVQSVHPANPAQLKFSINGIQIGQIFQANATPCIWKQFYIVWNSGNNTTANISLVNQNTQTNGNDFAIDDISFAPVLVLTDSVKVDLVNCPLPCVIKPDFTFTRNVCNSKEITFKNQTPNTSTFKWDFGNNTTNTTNQNPTVSYANNAGFWVQLIVTQTNGCKDSAGYFLDVNSNLDTSLIINKDTSICLGATFKINVKDTGRAYCWSASSGSVISNAISQTVTPNTNTVYYFNSKVIGNNLVVNGDFEAGNTGFTSEHSYKTPPRTSQSQYYIGTNPNVWFNPFVACKDHTSNGGNMMMFDGSAATNTAMWKQTVTVQPNTEYLFSGWVQSIVAQDPAQIILKINGNKVGVTTKADLNACSWKQFSAIWNSGYNTTANLSILDSNIVIQGNDFAIDDISFTPLIIKTDSVKVDVTNCSVNNACKGVVELHGRDKITPPAPIKKYFAATGFTWETWFNGSYYVNENTTVDTRSKLIAALDIPQCQDIVLGFGWPQVAQKNTLCFVADGPNGCTDRDNTPCTYFPTGGFQPNTWYHVAAVRDYANNTSKLYVNGALVDSKSNNHGPINPTLLPGFIFGSWTGLGSTDSGFAGKMDEIRIWNTPRTATEIQANYNKCLAGNETGLVAYYHSNEKTGSVLHDVSVNANNAALSSTITLNKTINAPITSPCLLATTTDSTKTIAQGQSYWGYTTSGIYKDTFVNSLGCDSIRTLNLTVISNIAIASFTAPDTVCVNSPVNIVNTSTGAKTYNWIFCSANINAAPIGTNIGNPGNYLSTPVSIDYILDNGNYYAFVVNYAPGGIVRLDFGNSLLNTPSAVNLGNIGGVINSTNGSEGIQIVNQNGKYFMFLVGGTPLNGTLPKLIRFEFGTNITNTTPIATDFGNIGNMNQSIKLFMFQDGSNWYGYTTNSENNTITRFDFTNDFTNTPTAINLGNIGNLFNYPTGISALRDNGVWRMFITNGKGNSDIIRLDFGTSLLNTPTALNLGNPNNNLSIGVDILMNKYCEDNVGYVASAGNNSLVKLNFATLSSLPTSTSFGNLGNLSKPHSLSKLFKVNADVYSFITNANNNTITRLKFQGCNNSSIPSSTSQSPPSISYNSPGTYNINLTIDDGLATQSVFCKKVVVVLPKRDSINHTICQGQTYLGHSIAGIYRDTFKTSNCDSIRVLNLKVLPATVTTLDTIPASCGSVSYNGNVYSTSTLVTTTIKNYLGCDSIIQNHQIIVKQNIRDTINVSICNGQSYLGFTVSGVYKIDSVRLSSGCDSITMVKLSVDKYIKDSINISICYGDKYGTYQYAGTYYDTIKSTTFCDTIRAINLSIKAKLNPKLLDDASICEKDSIVLNPGKFDFYKWNNGSTAPQIAVKNIGLYWVEVADTFGCKANDTFNLISINPLPKDFLPNSLSICDGEQYTLTGYNSYQWMTGETTPTISLTTLPTYSVKVTDTNGCSGADTMKVNYVGSLNIQPTNAFSPNEDGINETFKPFSGSCIVSYSMRIFDRWGQLLFETTNPNTGWNGKYKGNLLPAAVYYFVINYKNLLGINNKKAGSITLLR